MSALTVFKRIKNGIAHPKETTRRALVDLTIWYLQKYGQGKLEEICKKKSIEMGVKLSHFGVMTLLDREGIAHCFMCVERFELRKVGKRYACKAHVDQPAIREGTECA